MDVAPFRAEPGSMHFEEENSAAEYQSVEEFYRHTQPGLPVPRPQLRPSPAVSDLASLAAEEPADMQPRSLRRSATYLNLPGQNLRRDHLHRLSVRAAAEYKTKADSPAAPGSNNGVPSNKMADEKNENNNAAAAPYKPGIAGQYLAANCVPSSLSERARRVLEKAGMLS